MPDNGKTHGGRRAGAGRKPGPPTVRLRVPVEVVPQIHRLTKDAANKSSSANSELPADQLPDWAWEPPLEPTQLKRPLYGGRVEAGFPSPAADDFIEGQLDLHEHLIRRPASTFYFRVTGDSMTGAGIYPKDVLVVDRAEEVQHNFIVVALIDGGLTVKRLYRRPDGTALHSENRRYAPIPITADIDVVVWGVVNGVIRKYR